VNGRLRPAEQLPSVRRLAAVAGVNVNTLRAVYERLEGEGFIVTQHGRGSFVAENVPQLDPGAVAARHYAISGSPTTRDELKRQISTLEAHLPAEARPPAGPRSAVGARLLTTEELATVRDELAARLEQLETMREDLVGLLASVRMAMDEEPAPRPEAAPRATVRPQPAPSS
jgi:DNA-binding transcriptional regulator YhcF (GntR family)